MQFDFIDLLAIIEMMEDEEQNQNPDSEQSKRDKIFGDLDRSLEQASANTPAAAMEQIDSAALADAAVPEDPAVVQDPEPAVSAEQKVFGDLERSLQKASALTPTAAMEHIDPDAPPQIPTRLERAQPRTPVDPIPSTPKAVPAAEQAAPEEDRRIGRPDSRPPGAPDRRAMTQARISAIQTIRHSGKFPTATELPTAEEIATENDFGRNIMRTGIVVVGIAVLCGFGLFAMGRNEINFVFSEANKHFAKGEYRESLFLLDAALAKDPENARLHLQKGLALAKLRDYDNALTEFDLALQKGSARIPTLLASATAYSAKGDFENAIKQGKEIVEAHPECIQAYLLLANAYDHASQPEQAEQACTQGLAYSKKAEEQAQLFIERGYAKGRMGQVSDAELDLSEAIRKNPSTAAYMARGDVYKKLGQYMEAISDYSEVLKMDPNNYNALVARGIADNLLGIKDAALSDFTEALKLNKQGVEALIQRGSLNLSLKNYKAAAQDLEEAFKLNPRISETRKKLDLAYKNLRINAPKTILALESNDSQQEDTPAAPAEHFTLPSTVEELVSTGYERMRKGQLRYAAACFMQAVKLEPRNEQVRRYLAHTLFKLNDCAGAVSQFTALNDLSEIDETDISPYAQSLMRTGRNTEAAHLLEVWLHANPQDVNRRCELARLYMSSDRAKDAQRTIATGLSQPGLSPSNAAALRAVVEKPSAATGSAQSTPGSSSSGGEY